MINKKISIGSILLILMASLMGCDSRIKFSDRYILYQFDSSSNYTFGREEGGLQRSILRDVKFSAEDSRFIALINADGKYFIFDKKKYIVGDKYEDSLEGPMTYADFTLRCSLRDFKLAQK